MRILIAGADGFIGRNVSAILEDNHEVYKASRRAGSTGREVRVDLLDKPGLVEVIRSIKPDVIINCAGIIDPSADVGSNKVFSRNILEAVTESKHSPSKIIIMGSAGEYGILNPNILPVSETTPLNATEGYGNSKKEETTFALKYAKDNNLNVIIARIFNPIGANMHSKFLISRILGQIAEIKAATRDNIEVSRLDASRDYVDVRDIGLAIKQITEKTPKHDTYNVGSGIATSNKTLVDIILSESDLTYTPNIIETSQDPEPAFAIQADISRMENDFGWKPVYPITQTIKEIIHA